MAKRQDAAAIVRQIDAELDRLARGGRYADEDLTPVYEVGDRVEIQWRMKWYEGEVLGVNGDRYRVRYVGWDDDWDEDVSADRLRHPGGSKKRPPKRVETGHPRYRAGDSVMVEWDGAWYDGAIASVEGARYRVRYDAWDASWDELVDVQRLRSLVDLTRPKTQPKARAKRSTKRRPTKPSKPSSKKPRRR